jgi:hypothetical protein
MWWTCRDTGHFQCRNAFTSIDYKLAKRLRTPKPFTETRGSGHRIATSCWRCAQVAKEMILFFTNKSSKRLLKSNLTELQLFFTSLFFSHSYYLILWSILSNMRSENPPLKLYFSAKF